MTQEKLKMPKMWQTLKRIDYGLKKPDLFRAFGFHELFHCFVLLGSLLHYLVVAIYIL